MRGTAGPLTASSGPLSQLGSTIDVSHEDSIDQHHPIDHHPIDHHPIDHHPIDHHHHPIDHHQQLYNPHVHHSNANFYDWQQPRNPDLYEKTDAAQFNHKPEDAQRSLRASNHQQQRNPYTYFNIKTGEPVKNTERPRRDTRKMAPNQRSDQHLDLHSDIHSDAHSDVHPTTATFKDKRIAGVSCTITFNSKFTFISPFNSKFNDIQ